MYDKRKNDTVFCPLFWKWVRYCYWQCSCREQHKFQKTLHFKYTSNYNFETQKKTLSMKKLFVLIKNQMLWKPTMWKFWKWFNWLQTIFWDDFEDDEDGLVDWWLSNKNSSSKEMKRTRQWWWIHDNCDVGKSFYCCRLQKILLTDKRNKLRLSTWQTNQSKALSFLTLYEKTKLFVSNISRFRKFPSWFSFSFMLVSFLSSHRHKDLTHSRFVILSYIHI